MPIEPVFSPASQPNHRLTPHFETGILLDGSQNRVAWVSENLLQSIHTVFQRQLGEQSTLALYQLGRYWGIQFYRRVERQILAARVGIAHVHEISVRDFLRACDVLWAEMGWGHFELVRAHGQIFINFYNSPYAHMVGQQQANVDDLFAGIFAGIFSKLSGSRLECVEIMCLSNGYNYCRFLQGGEPLVQVIKNWQAQGATYEEIIHRIQQQTQHPK